MEAVVSPIYLSDNSGGEFTPHPEGQYAAVCIDAVDLGMVDTTFGTKHRVRLVFFCDEWTEREIEGEKRRVPLTVQTTMTASLHEKANLRRFLESWRGRHLLLDELGRFDLETVVGVGAYLQITHAVTERGTYANIQTIVKLPPGMAHPPSPSEYQRVKEREPRDEAWSESEQPRDDGLPF